MPGIAGIIGPGKPEEREAILRQMVQEMLHEPFYSSGTYSNERIGLWMGWVSHKESFSDGMPVWNETKDLGMIFSGEDFTDPEEIERLRARGHKCDTENAGYLIHLYEEKGIGAIERLNGRFSGVIVNLREPNVVLFNDRYGLNRIYYHQSQDGFVFRLRGKSASEGIARTPALGPCQPG